MESHRSTTSWFVPELPKEATSTVLKGKIRFGLHLGEEIASAWMGGFSLLTGPEEDPERQDYIYRFENGQFILAKAANVTLKGLTQSIDSRFQPEIFYLVQE